MQKLVRFIFSLFKMRSNSLPFFWRADPFIYFAHDKDFLFSIVRRATESSAGHWMLLSSLSLSVFIHSSSLSFNHSFLLHYLFLSIIHSLFIISLFHLFIITFFHPFIIPFFESFLHSSSSLSLSLSFFRSISVSTFLSLLLSQYYLLPFHQLPERAATLHCEKQNHIMILTIFTFIYGRLFNNTVIFESLKRPFVIYSHHHIFLVLEVNRLSPT